MPNHLLQHRVHELTDHFSFEAVLFAFVESCHRRTADAKLADNWPRETALVELCMMLTRAEAHCRMHGL